MTWPDGYGAANGPGGAPHRVVVRQPLASEARQGIYAVFTSECENPWVI